MEENMIIEELIDVMSATTSMQPDIDIVKVIGAATLAQDIDIKRIIGKTNLGRCITPITTEDFELQALITPAVCWFTYTRLLEHYGFVFTDGGTTEEDDEATKRNDKRASESKAVAEVYLQVVIEWLEEENPEDEELAPEKMTPSIRVVGGREIRASN